MSAKPKARVGAESDSTTVNRYTDEPVESVLALGFAQRVAQWVRANGGEAALANWIGELARDVSLATSDGQVCMALPESVTAAQRLSLLASGVVGSPDRPGAMPLILDEDGRLYLHRYFDYERRLARRLLAAKQAASFEEGEREAVAADLATVFAGNGPDSKGADWQRLAAALALRSRLTVISGGPGTGKTTTVVNLLACLIARDPQCRIALAAPTGKAAARMTEAIRQRASHLPATLRDRLPTESFTIHRLLGVRPDSSDFIHHAGNPLAIDTLVVDEASMLDLSLATRLLAAVPPSARIVLLGDKDQLAAVESGAVFSELSGNPALSDRCRQDMAALAGVDIADIVPPLARRPSPLNDSVVWFTHNFRFANDSGIGRFAALVNGGEAQPAIDWLQTGSDETVSYVDDHGRGLSAAVMAMLLAAFDGYAKAVRSDPADKAVIHAAFARFRVLCAQRRDPRGVIALNDVLGQRIRDRIHGPLSATQVVSASPWYAGRPVMVLRNDYLLKLFNGDIGITLPDSDGSLMVWFAQPDGGWRSIAPVRMPDHETAFAMTVHKAQGSEFDEVMVVLPEKVSRVLTRELLYTGVTRARQRVCVVGGQEVLAATIEAGAQRRSGLLARLHEAAGDLADQGKATRRNGSPDNTASAA